MSKKIIAGILALAIMMSCVGFACATEGLEGLLGVKFTVTPVTDGGGYILLLKNQYSPLEKVVARAVPNEGFVFYSWTSENIHDPNFEAYRGSDYIEFIMPANDVVLGAIFALKQAEEKQTVGVTFDSMGGTDFGTTYVEIGSPVAEPANVPVKEGYTFEGWFVDSVCTMPFDFSTPIYASTLLYAKWAQVTSEPVSTNVFSDVKQSDWYYSYVTALAERNIISGMGAGKFAPSAGITRAQLATILANLANANLADAETPFGDVSENAWYAKAVSWAYKNGIVNGISEDEFKPDAKISRQDMAVMIMRYVTNVAKVTLPHTVDRTRFSDDEQIASYASESVYAMQMSAIIGGKPGNLFDAFATATRAEASKMIYVLLELIEM